MDVLFHWSGGEPSPVRLGASATTAGVFGDGDVEISDARLMSEVSGIGVHGGGCLPGQPYVNSPANRPPKTGARPSCLLRARKC